jgi:hypothetical protein
MADIERILTYEQGDRFVSFKVEQPPLTHAEARDLPRVRHPGSGGGIDTSGPIGVWQTEEASVFAFEGRNFSFMGVEEYAHTVANHIGATLMEPAQVEEAPSI